MMVSTFLASDYGNLIGDDGDLLGDGGKSVQKSVENKCGVTDLRSNI